MAVKRIAIVTTQVPFVEGGAEMLARGLREALTAHGFQADIVTMPFKWYPPDQIVRNILCWRLTDLSEADGRRIDMVVALKFPAYCVDHESKLVWLVHQHGQAYHLWGAEDGGLSHHPEGPRVREIIHDCDTRFLSRARALYAISRTVAHRLKDFNGLSADVLYPPSPLTGLLQPGEPGDFIFCPSRLVQTKRQDKLIEAMSRVTTRVRAVIAGTGPEAARLEGLISKHSLGDRVELVGHVSSRALVEFYKNCLAVFFGPYDEDYGYVTIEAFSAGKPVITFSDSGGPLEFVTDEENGFVLDPGNPDALAQVIDRLYSDKASARRVGKSAREHFDSLDITWSRIVERLTG